MIMICKINNKIRYLFLYNIFPIDSLISHALLPLGVGGWPMTVLMTSYFSWKVSFLLECEIILIQF